jgi:hypothetical protein
MFSAEYDTNVTTDIDTSSKYQIIEEHDEMQKNLEEIWL